MTDLPADYPRRLFEPAPWMTDAACKGMDPALFFPTQGQPVSKHAKAACQTCPVLDVCREAAITDGSLHGYWGGTSERQRRAIRKELGIKNSQRKPIRHGTSNGYKAHRRYNEDACAACLVAYAADQRAAQAERRAKAKRTAAA